MDAAQSDRAARYDDVAILLHWLMAVVIIAAIGAGLLGASLKGPAARPYVDIHKSLGLTALALVAVRIAWRLVHLPPPQPDRYGRLTRAAAKSAHLALYALMLLLPLSGYVHDSAWREAATHPIRLYGLVEVPRLGFVQALDPDLRDRVHDVVGALHVWLGYALYALLALHLLGVVKHHMLDRDRVLQRMLPMRRLSEGRGQDR